MIRFLKSFFLTILVLVGGTALWVFWQIPSEKEIKGCLVTQMYGVNLCPGSKDYVPLNRISPNIQRAVIMSEDASFYTHHGFDWESLEKSARENWAKGQFKRGGSTISQQLAKNMFLTKDKTLVRKGIEALITMKIEKTLTKKEILERYLNVVEFGRGIFGVKNAARIYFNKSPAELDVTESAFLAMILPSPVKYSRSFHQKALTPFARRRIQRILNDMQKTGKIGPDEYVNGLDRMETFLGGRPPVVQEPPPEPGDAPTPPEDEESEDDLFDSVF